MPLSFSSQPLSTKPLILIASNSEFGTLRLGVSRLKERVETCMYPWTRVGPEWTVFGEWTIYFFDVLPLNALFSHLRQLFVNIVEKYLLYNLIHWFSSEICSQDWDFARTWVKRACLLPSCICENETSCFWSLLIAQKIFLLLKIINPKTKPEVQLF